MERQPMYTSVTRIADLDTDPFTVAPLERERWDDGDYVLARVTGSPTPLYRIELPNGRIGEVMAGDRLVGALGCRHATLEAVGDWRSVGEDLQLHALTGAGLFGRATSVAPLLPRLMTLSYEGHLVRAGDKLVMSNFVKPVGQRSFATPTILLVGTSMSAGKTTTGRVIIHALKAAGLKVVGAKFTGAGRYRDVLAFQDAGADAVLDFVDAGLPSTVVSAERFSLAMDYMLARVAQLAPDVLVAEAGASPMEPYNGAVAVAALGEQRRCTVLSASDPYAVVGVQTAFDLKPDIVTGPAVNTAAAVELVNLLTGTPGINVLAESELPALLAILRARLPGLL